jgi:seryl-tRNA(Sec) selenium transferase
MSSILPQFVEMNDLQRKASAIIARLTGGEAGFVTASCSAGISLAVAGAITGNDLLAIEKLPEVPRRTKCWCRWAMSSATARRSIRPSGLPAARW